MNDIAQWKQVAAMLHDALPEIDRRLSQSNVPLSLRANEAFDMVRQLMLTVSDFEAFLVSDAHGKLRLVVQDWYRERYGDRLATADDQGLVAMLLIHGTPFLFFVPKYFRTKSDVPNTIWIGFPASVQVEENPLTWFQDKSVVERLSSIEAEALRAEATDLGDLIRSIGFDLGALTYEVDASVSDLAEAIMTDLQASARHLCARTNAGLRSAEWDASQATEKAIKLFIRRKGQIPPFSHDLEQLAQLAERLGAPPINRDRLRAVPSDSSATSKRYGGRVELAEAVGAYRAAVATVRDLAFEARPESEYNVRQARFLVKSPAPWFEFDTDLFLRELREATVEGSEE